ncbi:hypothetical protein UMC2_23821 [[Clostridium] sordellii]|uniref:helix-turn-helix domain-containing protein n=1 Tax=Paraclostridium sordellii TaxID=1505 RepID=UPI0005428701|nr:helix-turn-helix transcriptional regulator [Paeniclostridium sordellii]CEK35426.1 hypothetical protein UMC2_23821 [[Clostridium] sordellii] [Paeniclostridium sordellii]
MNVKVNKMALIKAIAETGKTTSTISVEAGIGDSTIGRIINSKTHKTHINTLTKLSKALGIDLEELVEI